MIGTRSTRGLVLACALAGLAGCGGGGEPAQSRSDAQKAAKSRQLETLIGELERAVLENPLAMKDIVNDAKNAIREARDVGLPEVEEKLIALQQRARDAFRDAAEKETKTRLEEVRTLLAEGRVSDARQRLIILRRQVEDTPHVADVDAEVRRVATAMRASRVYGDVVASKLETFADGAEWEKARGLLEGYLLVEEFALTDSGKAAKQKLEEIGPKATAAKEERLKEAGIEWTLIFNGEREQLLNLDHSDPSTTRVDGGVIQFESQDERAMLSLGDQTWADYIVEVVFALPRGKVHFWVRGEAKDGSRDWKKATSLEDREVAGVDSVRIRIELRGHSVRYRVYGKTVWADGHEIDNLVGPFMIMLDPDSRMEIKEVWAKVLSKAGG